LEITSICRISKPVERLTRLWGGMLKFTLGNQDMMVSCVLNWFMFVPNGVRLS
jgi:hypothetical protein